MACPVWEPVGKQGNHRDKGTVQEFEEGAACSVLKTHQGLWGVLGSHPHCQLTVWRPGVSLFSLSFFPHLGNGFHTYFTWGC